MRNVSLTTAQLVAEARQHAENLSPEPVAAEREAGQVLLVDIREPE